MNAAISGILAERRRRYDAERNEQPGGIHDGRPGAYSGAVTLSHDFACYGSEGNDPRGWREMDRGSKSLTLTKQRFGDAGRGN